MSLSCFSPPEDVTGPYAIAPIREASPDPSRRVALLAAVVIPGALVYWGLEVALPRLEPRPTALPKSVAVRLDTVWPEPVPPPPIREAPEGPGDAVDLPGLGHVRGNGAIDPALLALPEARRPPMIPSDDPEALVLTPQAPLPPVAGLNRHLPVAPGGNGLARGTGQDAGRGGRRLSPGTPDYKLVLLHQEPADTDLTANSAELMVPVKVLVLIGEEGRPTSARVLSGPEPLHAPCIQAALRYRWEPLEPHGLKAPIEMVLTFHPMVRATNRRPGAPPPRRN